MGAKLNEAAACYSREGWDRFYLAVTGMDCNSVLDLFCELLRDPNPIKIKDLDEPQKKKARIEAAEFKEEALKEEGIPETSEMKTVYPTGSMNYTISILTKYQPTQHLSKHPSKATGNLVSHTSYHCTMCTYHPFNRDSTYTHTRHHLNIVIGCAWPDCGKTYDAPDGLSKHVKTKHGGQLILGGVKIGGS